MPHEGASGSNTQTDAWYNVLPPYVNMLPYGQVYTGAVVTGPLYGYANDCIWYCPKQMVVGPKNASSGKNSFHYAMNDVLNGSSGYKDVHSKYNQVRNNSMYSAAQPSYTVLFMEPQDNVPVCESLPSSTADMARGRHFGTSLNFLFVDGHVDQINSNVVSLPAQDSTTGVWSSSNPTLIWGPIAD